MENILKMADAVDQQWMKKHQQLLNNTDNNNFKSFFKINGKSILSPLMTPERRVEMQQHRQAAIDIEKQVSLMSKLPLRVRKVQAVKNVDASTNTVADSGIIVMGHRFPQKLQMSQTLIYDNKCNTIIKFNKTPIVQSVGQWSPQLEPQYPMTIKAMPKFAKLVLNGPKIDALKELGLTPIVYQSCKSNRMAQEQLQRASTSPLLHSPNSPNPNANNDRLQTQLWKRYHSYPLGYKVDKPASSNTALILPSNKLETKQQQTTPEQAVKSTRALKPSTSKAKKRLPRPTYSSVAHAHSHAKAEQASSDGSNRISCTQRRLSYDPRATQRKKKVEPTAVAIVSDADLKKKKLLENMEQEQRQRFQQLISQQADEQQHLQTEFHLQQQHLIDQMLEEHDAHSETSSIASLPQSSVDLDIDDVETDI